MSTSSSPQRGLRTTIQLDLNDIQELFSNPKPVLPVQEGYINVFASASAQYVFKDDIFTNVDNVLGFYQKPAGGGPPVLVSNSINALAFMGLEQNGSLNFIAANPYSPSMEYMINAPVVFQIDGGDPVGGNALSTILIVVTYDLYLA